jgi:hypothetical protein
MNNGNEIRMGTPGHPARSHQQFALSSYSPSPEEMLPDVAPDDGVEFVQPEPHFNPPHVSQGDGGGVVSGSGVVVCATMPILHVPEKPRHRPSLV